MWSRFLFWERMLNILVREDSEDGSWYWSMFRCFFLRTFFGKASLKNFWIGFRLGLDFVIRIIIV